MPRPPYEPTDKQRNEVKALAAFGITEIDIAEYLGIAVNTMRKHFARELKVGAIEANAAVAKRLFQKAKDGDTTAMIWWTKARMRWKETRTEEVTGKDGGPVQFEKAPRVFLPPLKPDTDDEQSDLGQSGESKTGN